MRMVCTTSTSTSDVADPHSTARKTVTKKQPTEPKRRTSARLLEQGKQKAEDSRKIQQKRKKTQAQQPKTPVNVTSTKLYIGNLIPATSCDILKRIFANFGTVSSVMLHCSSGLAVSRVRVPKSSILANDRQYATVDFYEASAANQALVMDGAELNGQKIVVSFAPTDMPEATQGLPKAKEEDSAMSL